VTAVSERQFMAERLEVARACRVLAMEGLVSDILGHVSLRVGAGLLLIRARGPADQGLLLSAASDVVLVDADGTPAEDLADHTLPQELAIHLAVLRRQPTAAAVVHAHPPDVVACSIGGLALEPIFGAFSIPAMRLAERGIPVYRYYGPVRDRQRGEQMAGVMGDGQAVVLAGHGLTTAGASLAAAVVTALNVNRLAAMTLALATAGRSAPPVPAADRAELPDLGSGFNDHAVWRAYLAKLAASGLAPPSAAELGAADQPGAADQLSPADRTSAPGRPAAPPAAGR
jgi:3,4-dihydroxyphthalate decarboxylase